jgi:ubiquinone/menaquinone biosynthesis C-methylase UbiE
MTLFGKEYSSTYDYLYQDKDYDRECDFIEKIFLKSSSRVNSILDLGCGTGGHSLILAKRGYDVTGVDRSKEMIEIAKKKADNFNIPLKFINSDINCTNLNKNFDAVISMFSVINYQTTNTALSEFCKIAKKHLKNGGIFIFDSWYGPAVISQRPKECIKEIKIDDSKTIIRFTQPSLNILKHIVEVSFKVWYLNKNKLVKKTEESHIMRFLFPQEIKYFLEVAGFKEIEFFPFLELKRQLTEQDWNMFVIAK